MMQQKRFLQIKRLTADIVYGQLDSPVGILNIIASAEGIHNILWQHESESILGKQILASLHCHNKNNLILETKKQLQEYFANNRKVFALPLAPVGTAFQLQVWQALRAIPYGQTISYGAQACMLGNKNKARAVGMANGLNPISIIVPCHRVIGANGLLTGFGGGLAAKEYLLNLERGYL
jgi:methylated-DNA-[protein]-cysteine S-methyltransferase